MRRLHESGFVHRDLYLSHIFFEQSREGCVQLALIDLQRVLTPNLRRQRWFVKDLAALDYSTPPTAASRSDRLRWFLRYRETGRLAEADRAFVRAVVRKSRRIARRDMRERLKATCDPQAQPGPEGTMPPHFFRADDRTRVWAADTARGRMVYKRFEAPTWRQVVLLLCGQHPAQLERTMNRRLRDAGIPTVPIVYHGLERSGLRIRAWQATPFMGLSLHRRFRGRTESGDALERSVDAAARLTANLIRAGFSFKDLKPSNIIIDDGGEAWLIDVGSVRRSTREAQVKRMLGVMERTLQRTGASEALRARFRKNRHPILSPRERTASAASQVRVPEVTSTCSRAPLARADLRQLLRHSTVRVGLVNRLPSQFGDIEPGFGEVTRRAPAASARARTRRARGSAPRRGSWRSSASSRPESPGGGPARSQH